jgi:hypothetical protein
LPKLANPQRLWRNPDTASRYFRSAASEGEAANLIWRLEFDYADETTGGQLQLLFTVHGNGTILKLTQGGKDLRPIMQFHRPVASRPAYTTQP